MLCSFVLLFLFYFLKLINLFLAAQGLRCCAWAFSSCIKRGLLFVAVRGLLIAVASLVAVRGLLIAVASIVAEHGLQVRGLQQLWLAGSRVQAQQLWRMGLVALRHVGSSWTRARTHVPYIGRWILNHCASREALVLLFLDLKKMERNKTWQIYCLKQMKRVKLQQKQKPLK